MRKVLPNVHAFVLGRQVCSAIARLILGPLVSLRSLRQLHKNVWLSIVILQVQRRLGLRSVHHLQVYLLPCPLGFFFFYAFLLRSWVSVVESHHARRGHVHHQLILQGTEVGWCLYLVGLVHFFSLSFSFMLVLEGCGLLPEH